MQRTRILALTALLASATLAAPAMAECTYPKTPGAPPNGSKATLDEMKAGKATIDKYQTDVNEYLACLDKEADQRVADAGDNADQVKQIKQVTAKRHNAAIDELSARVEEFNQQLRAYKSKNKG